MPSMMGAVAKHVFLVTDPTRLEATVRTAFEIARTGRPGPVVVDIPKDVQNWEGVFHGGGMLPIPGYRRRMQRAHEQALLDTHDAARFFEHAGRVAAPADLCRRRRDQRRRGGGADANSRIAFGIPVVTTLMGIGAIDTTAPAVDAHARHARRGVRQLRGRGLRLPDRRRRALRRPGGRRAGEVRAATRGASRTWTSIAPRSTRSSARTGATSGSLPEALRALSAHGRREQLPARLQRPGTRSSRSCKRVHAMNYDRASPLIQPLLRDRGDQPPHARRGDHHAPASASTRCGRRSTSISATRGCGSPRAAWARWASACRRRSARRSPTRSRLVIDVDGDASIRMNIGELETVTTYDLPVKVVVLNNFGDGMVKQWQKLFFKGRLSASDKSLHKKDFVKAAQADGFRYARRLDRKAGRAARDRGVPGLRGAGVPRGDDRSGRRRLSDGRTRAGLRGDDHRATSFRRATR